MVTILCKLKVVRTDSGTECGVGTTRQATTGHIHISRVDAPLKRILRHRRVTRARIRARTPSAPNRGVKNLPNRGGLVEVGRAATRHAVLGLELPDTGHVLGQDVGRREKTFFLNWAHNP